MEQLDDTGTHHLTFLRGKEVYALTFTRIKKASYKEFAHKTLYDIRNHVIQV